ncbi:MAG: hypothetical protein AAF151_25835 [Cyanobacteria bacterium J06656_5]
MQGVAVPRHSDGIAAYRPMIMLDNPRDNYTIRGIGQSWNISQSAGTVLVLDIDQEHERLSAETLLHVWGHGWRW